MECSTPGARLPSAWTAVTDSSASSPSRMARPTRPGRRQLLVLFSKAVSDAGIVSFRYHDLRHTFATRLRAAGVHEYDIADLLGHSTTKTDTRGSAVTRGYAHGIASRLREAFELLCTSNVAEFRRQAAG